MADQSKLGKEEDALTLDEELEISTEKACMIEETLSLRVRAQIEFLCDLAQNLVNGEEDREKELKNVMSIPRFLLGAIEKESKKEDGDPKKYVRTLEKRMISSIARLRGMIEKKGNGLHDEAVKANDWWKKPKA